MNKTNAISLTIAIPTFNRCQYLKELIPDLLEQVKSVNNSKNLIQVLISNNASTDETEDFITPFVEQGLITYRKNLENIGADRNIMKCVEEASGKYVWIFGDDELLQDAGILNAYHLVVNNNYELIILSDGQYDSKLTMDTSFETLFEFISKMSGINPHLLLAHTLITSNIFKKSAYSVTDASKYFYTNYSMMYGIINGMLIKDTIDDAVYVSTVPIIKVRDSRAIVEIEYSDLLQKQVNYLRYLASTFNIKPLNQYATRFYLIGFLRLTNNRLITMIGKIPFIKRLYRAIKKAI
jgi:glycosyltransferase involved in cell wall biosynthesis